MPEYESVGLDAGTVGAPSLYHNDDANDNTGIFWPGAGELGFSAGGKSIAQIMSQGLRFSNRDTVLGPRLVTFDTSYAMMVTSGYAGLLIAGYHDDYSDYRPLLLAVSPWSAETQATLKPQYDNEVDLGSDARHYKDAFAYRVLTKSGSAAAPSHSFSDETGLGMRRYGSGTLAWSVGGSDELILTASALRPYSDGGLALGAADRRWL
jgi:hypothetical protein